MVLNWSFCHSTPLRGKCASVKMCKYPVPVPVPIGDDTGNWELVACTFAHLIQPRTAWLRGAVERGERGNHAEGAEKPLCVENQPRTACRRLLGGSEIWKLGENLKTTLTTGVNEQDGRTSQPGRASKFASTSSLFVGLGCHGCFHFHFLSLVFNWSLCH